ncbi:transcription factor GTE9-like [Ananas comosus]|uniref:Transcription factor GTE9-like n=1 Tax=Ananas comosus TaxID=4615 RepID=A0A6P5FJI5_ANACO|nr:transcription factor GTE9-like [Ananas comosus]
MSKKRRIAEACREQTDSGNHSAVEEIASAEKSEVTSTVTGVSKVRFLVNSQIAGGKVEKMDITKMRLCANILKKLMNHRYGWVFNQPVDPVKLNIPDYFSIISKPMDLGTVNKKLMSKLYVSTHQFAADVRLTFSNAMRYNPPGNDVHIMALELNNLFNLAWKSLECNWRKENPNLVKQAETNKRAIGRSNSFPKRSLTKSEKLKLRKDLAKIPVRKMPARLLNFLRKECMLEKIGERINVDIDMFDDEVLVELHQVLKSILDAGPAKPSRVIRKYPEGPGQCSWEGDANAKALTRLSDCANGTCGSLYHCSNRSNDLSEDVDLARFSGRNDYSCHSMSSNLEDMQDLSGVQIGDPSSELAEGVVEGDKAYSPSHPSSPATIFDKGENDILCEELLSPSRALRAAMLKSRFADTIVKAQQKALLDHGKKIDPVKLQMEREKLKKRQQEEKARIEAQVKAAEAAAKMRAEAELKRQREREREAARLALQMMKKTVDIDNSEFLKDLERLSYCQTGYHLGMHDDSWANYMDGIDMKFGTANPLEKLGLFMKHDEFDEEAEDWVSATGHGDVEEGEIGC